jgi:hypothetical protein
MTLFQILDDRILSSVDLFHDVAERFDVFGPAIHDHLQSHRGHLPFAKVEQTRVALTPYFGWPEFNQVTSPRFVFRTEVWLFRCGFAGIARGIIAALGFVSREVARREALSQNVP